MTDLIERLEKAKDWLERNSVLRNPAQQTISEYLALLGEAETLPGGDNAYDPPPDGWVCFHCGIRFLTERAAREHFGPTPDSHAACLRALKAKEASDV